MKKNYYNLLFSLVGLLMLSTVGTAQTYVDQDASGAGDGTSWADAYTNLNDALSSTTSGEIWVADGTYLPNETVLDSSATFLISSEISLYGGFNGSEGSLDDRDPNANVTTLSGDLNSDDFDNDFVANKTDNIQHVVVVDSLLASVTIDGFNISGGYTSNLTNDLTDFFNSGGGIYSLSTVIIKNCNFSQNFGRAGSGLYISSQTGGGNGSEVENCSFNNNFATNQSAGIFILGLSDVNIINTNFVDNTTVRGALYPRACSNVNIVGCNFDNNADPDPFGFGAAVFNWQSFGLNFTDCTFTDNVTGNGTAFYSDGRFLPKGLVTFTMNNCTFTNNEALNFGGGAIYSFQSSYDLDNCTFNTCTASNGAAIFANGANDFVNVTNCVFEEGIGDFGGAINCYGDSTIYSFANTTFQNNMTNTSGGTMMVGFGAIVRIDDCNFNNNQSQFGGVMYVQTEETDLEITNSTFDSNNSTDFGGVINTFAAGDILVDNCNFLSNVSDVGAVISVSESTDTIVPMTMTVSNSVFDFNVATTQGAAINTFNSRLILTNSLFTRNFNTMGGAGGAISINGSVDSISRTVDIINNTIVNNSAPIGSGISAFTSDDIGNELTINLQNNIFSNPLGQDIEIEGGSPNIVSLGGNIGSDAAAAIYLTDATDQNEVADVMFTDVDQVDFHLEPGSPAINAGIDAGAPEFDIEGNPRVGAVDAGAYEYQEPLNTENLVANNGQLTIFPNPVSALLNFELHGEWNSTLTVKIFNIKGQEVRSWQTVKSAEVLQESVNVNNFTKGIYDILISDGNKTMVERFIKM